jgi:hypothetical protein
MPEDRKEKVGGISTVEPFLATLSKYIEDHNGQIISLMAFVEELRDGHLCLSTHFGAVETDITPEGWRVLAECLRTAADTLEQSSGTSKSVVIGGNKRLN